MHLVLYSKPDCCLCERLEEKLRAITTLNLVLEVRDITSREDWLMAYQYEVPVLMGLVEDGTLQPIPRPAPRLSVMQLETWLRKNI
jgi:hypothetical protein